MASAASDVPKRRHLVLHGQREKMRRQRRAYALIQALDSDRHHRTLQKAALLRATTPRLSRRIGWRREIHVGTIGRCSSATRQLTNDTARHLPWNYGCLFGIVEDSLPAVPARCRHNAPAHDEYERRQPIRFSVEKLKESCGHCGRADKPDQHPQAARDEHTFDVALRLQALIAPLRSGSGCRSTRPTR